MYVRYCVPYDCVCARLIHEVKVSGMRRHRLEVQSSDTSSPNTDNFRLIVVSYTHTHAFSLSCALLTFKKNVGNDRLV